MVECSSTVLPYFLRFVSAIPVTGAPATVLMDLNDGTWCSQKESRFDPPALDRAKVSTLLADGDTYPADAYRNRTVELHLSVQAASADALATQLQLLVQQLDKPNNVLQYQPKTTQAVYFRTFRAPPDAVTIIKRGQSTALVVASIPAEPFAYGSKQLVPAVTVNMDPAAVSNGLYFDVTGVLGDVETPLFVSANAANLTGGTTAGMTTLVATRRRGTPSNAPFLLQAESMAINPGTDTTTQANSASFSGAGNNWTRTTFATVPGPVFRLSASPFPASASVDNRGTYRVYARLRHTVATDVITVQLQASYDTALINNDTVTLPTTTANIMYADLGLLQFPAGLDPQYDGYSNTELSVEGFIVSLITGRTSGTGNLDVDYLLFVPADDRFSLTQWSRFSGPTSYVLDGRVPTAYATGTTGAVRSVKPIPFVGLLPMVNPNQTNRVYFIRDVGTGALASDNSITATVAVNPYYWPRYLRVRPVTT